MSEEDRVATGASASVVAAVTALAGVAGHPNEAIAVAAISSALQPLFEEQLHWVLDVVRRLGRRRRITPATLEAELTGSPAKQELLIRALDASRTASAEEKRRAIAASIAAGLESDLDAARENDVLRLIADLDLVHVLALQIMSQPRPLLTNAAFLGQTSFEMSDLGEIDGRLRGLEERVMAVLVSHGLVADETSATFNSAMDSYRITNYGRLILARFTDPEQAKEADRGVPSMM